MIDFSKIKDSAIDSLYGGSGAVAAKFAPLKNAKAMISTIGAGCSIGEHIHVDSCEFIYVLSGSASCTLDGVSETVSAGQCHFCPKWSRHSVANCGDVDLVVFDAVAQQ